MEDKIFDLTIAAICEITEIDRVVIARSKMLKVDNSLSIDNSYIIRKCFLTGLIMNEASKVPRVLLLFYGKSYKNIPRTSKVAKNKINI